jgi:hypothetical protein
VPMMGEPGQQRAEHDGAEAGEEKAEGEPGRGGTGAALETLGTLRALGNGEA